MDMFIDKFAQRRNAQEMIRANYMAEAEENERLSEQVGLYEQLLAEVRKLNLQSIENEEKAKSLLEACVEKIAALDTQKGQDEMLAVMKVQMKDLQEQIREYQEQNSRNAEKLAQLAELVKEMGQISAEDQEAIAQLVEEKVLAALEGKQEEADKQLSGIVKGFEDFDHREAVKVYRNVQAVIEEESAKQTAAILEQVDEKLSKQKVSGALVPIGVLTLLVGWANIVILAAHILGFL